MRQLLVAELGNISHWRKTAIKGQDPEGVHQLRVSLRKMRSALSIFSPVITNNYRKRWRRKLKRLARQMDEARDLDVFLETHFTQQPVRAGLHQALFRQQQRAYKKLARLLRSAKFKKPLRTLRQQLSKKRWQNRYCVNPHLLLSDLATNSLQQLFEQISTQQANLEINDEAALHQLRISFKQLRYGCEFLQPVLNLDQNQAYIGAMKALQDQLGDIHDAAVQQSMLATLPSKAQAEFSEIAEQSRQNSMTLKMSLKDNLTAFIQLPLPWAELRVASKSG